MRHLSITHFHKTAGYAFILIFSLLAGVLLTGQLLGFCGIYYTWLVIPLSLLLTGLIAVVLIKKALPLLLRLAEPEPGMEKRPILDVCGYLAGGLLLLLLIVPLALWPYTGINQDLTWDAGLYHLPKAVELVTSHSTWDFTIAYGEYPWGYESLAAFSFLFSSDGSLLGVVHALIAVLFALAFFFLAARFTHLPRGLLFFGVMAVICSFDLARGIESNPWWVFRPLIFTIGKNDLFLAAAILSLLAFSPLGLRGSGKVYSLEGAILAATLVISTKPNGLLIAGFALALVLLCEIQTARREQWSPTRLAKRYVPAGLILFTGLLWAVRNLVGLGQVISADSLNLQQWSILSNLSNPFFYQHIDLNIKVTLALFLVSIAAACFYRNYHWTIPLTFFILIVTFAATPASAFVGSTQQPAQIAWRFGAALLAFEFTALLGVGEPAVQRLGKLIMKPAEWIIGIVILFVAVWGCWQNLAWLNTDPQNTRVLRDYFPEPVGEDGYYSAYDYVQKNVRGAVVWVENGLPFYVYGPGLTNTVTRARPADYLVFFKAGDFPAAPPSAAWLLVYEDREGRVYQRR